ncbi:TPA: hypoxanthine phosphoribosyltransferase [Candidatus Galligastranaerophilus faecipullorum]|nr:hypoxanthine phosphoribosyltransferase [Candidatus Galligastranaerophilus faecipullorum]
MSDKKELKVLIKEEDLKKRIAELAGDINEYYGVQNELTIVCVLKGAVMFFCELAKYLKMPVRMEFVSLSSYGDAQKSSGKVSALNLSLPPLEDKNVLVVEDIMDTGLTLNFLLDFIRSKCKARDVKLAVMFDKKCARKYPVKPDFSAYDVGDKFIVGFGLDYCELQRNLPYIGYYE